MSHAPRVVAVVLGLGLLGIGCHHRVAAADTGARTTAGSPPSAARPPAPPPAPPRAAATPTPLSDEELFRRKSLDELNAEHPLGDVFFDYDQNALREDAQVVLQRDAAWLKKWSQTRLTLEGHCDERGSAEYNLGLGDRRAAVARDYLVSLGVSPDRLVLRSVGKEAPFCRDQGEACWSQNRRDHLIIIAK